jgi:hypothetical protein
MGGTGGFGIGADIFEGSIPSCGERGDVDNQTGVSIFGAGALYISSVPS